MTVFLAFDNNEFLNLADGGRLELQSDVDPVPHSTVSQEELELAIVMKLDGNAPTKYFSDYMENVSYGGNTYNSGMVISTGEIQSQLANNQARIRTSLKLKPESLGDDPVKYNSVEMNWLIRKVGENDWYRIHSEQGVPSGITVDDESLVSFDLGIVPNDQEQISTLVWDNATQQSRYPGDKGFEFLSDVASSNFETRWPPQLGGTGFATPGIFKETRGI